MTVKNISKYYYHEYVLIAFLLLMITACIAIFILDFTPTAIVKIGAIILATLLYFLMLIYFYILYRHGEWIIPRTWKNAQKDRYSIFLSVSAIRYLHSLYEFGLLSTATVYPYVWSTGCGQHRYRSDQKTWEKR